MAGRRAPGKTARVAPAPVNEEAWLSRTLSTLQKMPQAPSSPSLAKGGEKPTPSTDAKLGRPRSPNAAWCASTLATLKQTRKGSPRAGKDGHSAFEPGQLNRSHGNVSSPEPWQTEQYGDATEQYSDDGDQPTVQKHKSQMDVLNSMLPDAQMVMERLKGGFSGEFSEPELERMKATFVRYKVPDTQEVHQDDLKAILEHLGYTQIKEDEVLELSKTITDYSTLELPDFIRFVQKYAETEHHRFQAMFNEFDDDQSGALDEEELVKFLTFLGFTPLRKMVKEALAMVDVDGNGTLDFEEVVLLLHVYRYSEGFTAEEIQGLTGIFNRDLKIHKDGTKATTVPADALANILMQFFGPVVAEWAKDLQNEIMSGGTSQKQKTSEAAQDGEKVIPTGVTFSECLLWARKLRDKEFDMYRKAFHDFDDDGSGAISMQELKACIKHCGYTLPQKAVNELLTEAKDRGEWHGPDFAEDPDCEMDYDVFVHVMQILHESEGFAKGEVEEIQSCFDKFDEDQSGDMDVIELTDLLHYMGHTTKMDEVQLLVAKVDYNCSGTLHFREFLRLMRLHREDEVNLIRDVYEEHEDDEEMLNPSAVTIALNQLAMDDNERRNQVPKLADGSPKDFDDFMELVDNLRAVRVIELRKRAGFNDAELTKFKQLFEKYDTTKMGCVPVAEVNKFLAELGFQFRTIEEQTELVQQLKDSRAVAAERGVVDEDPSQVSFWVVIQLLRALFRRDDRQTLNKVNRAADQCQFSIAEVDQFREIFHNWFEKDSLFEDPEVQLENEMEDKKELSKASIRRLLRSLGLALTPKDREDLDFKITTLSDRGMVDFADFLRLMKWMMEQNLGNINNASGKDR
jgi:Ca2+-binding EF-hand superfamily protein